MTPYRTYALDDKEALRTSFGAHCRACHTKTQHYMHPLEHGNIYDCLGEGGGAPYNGTTRFIVRNKCTNCGHISYDLAEQTGGEIRFTRISPPGAPAEIPDYNEDTPEPVAQTYTEAATVYPISPRASAALMRLALEQLLATLLPQKQKLNDKIAALKKSGIPEYAVQYMDSVRVFGNNSVHPGEININEDPDLALNLFGAFNYIVDELITRERKAKALFKRVPQKDRENIAKRDN